MLIQSQRRYWAYEPMTLDLDDVLSEAEDDDVQRVASFLSDIRTEFQDEGYLSISFQAPDGSSYAAGLFAVEPDPDDFDLETEDEDEQISYSWMIEITRAGDSDPVDYEGIFHAPAEGEPILVRDTMGVLAAIAEAVYAESDQDHGSPHSILGDGLL